MPARNDSNVVIMVVDDNECNREILNVFLSHVGYRVIEASDGLEALRVATTESPHLIIMDLSMPVLDGFAAVQLLREIPKVSDVPIVACTAHDTPAHRLQALKVGFNAFLAKPIDFHRLSFLLQKLLNGGQPSAMATGE